MTLVLIYISISAFISIILGTLIYKVFDFFIDIFTMFINSILK